MNKIFLAILIIFLGSTFLGGTIAQEHSHNSHKKDNSVNIEHSANNIVHEGIIDLKKIDVNKDGKVFQDQMDWNVISDKPGKCPLCKMTLVEVTLKKAKENLIRNKFKVK